MPIDHVHAIRAGSAARLLLVFAQGADGMGFAGLSHTSPGAGAAFVRTGERAARPLALVAGRLGSHVGGGLVEVDGVLLPGVYQLGLPDEMLAEGSERALLMLRLPPARVAPIDVHLVRYDPQDSWCMGVEGLANHRRHEFLRRAMPRLTEMELHLGREAEEALKAHLTGDQESA